MNDIFIRYRTEILRSLFVVAALVVGGLLFVYPIFAELAEVKGQIAQTRSALERQTVFLPEYKKLAAQAEPGGEAELEIPKPSPVPIGDISELPTLVGACAREEGMSVLDVVMSPGSLKTGGGRLKLQAIVEGDVVQFGGFYRRLAGLGEVAGISQVEMQATTGGVEFFVELWVHMQERAG